jgi:hypothetical protein
MVQKGEEIDQLELLEQRVESLIRYVASVKHDKQEMAEKIRIQEEKITALTDEVERLRLNRDKARQSIVSLLEKIEHLEV